MLYIPVNLLGRTLQASNFDFTVVPFLNLVTRHLNHLKNFASLGWSSGQTHHPDWLRISCCMVGLPNFQLIPAMISTQSTTTKPTQPPPMSSQTNLKTPSPPHPSPSLLTGSKKHHHRHTNHNNCSHESSHSAPSFN